jgi:hypothetical protein
MTINHKISALRSKIAQTPDGALLVSSNDLRMMLDMLDRTHQREKKANTLLVSAQKLIEAREPLKHAQGLIDSANIRAYDTVIPSLDRLQDRLDVGDVLKICPTGTSYELVKPSGRTAASGKTVRELMVNLVMTDC